MLGGAEIHSTFSIYCKDDKRKGRYPTKKFTFLGYSFQPRGAQRKKDKKSFTGFLPAVSKEAGKKFRDRIKELGILKRTQLDIDEIACVLNPVSRGWYNYFSCFYKSALSEISSWLDCALVRWIRRKFRLRWRNARRFLHRLANQDIARFYHWQFRDPRRAV